MCFSSIMPPSSDRGEVVAGTCSRAAPTCCPSFGMNPSTTRLVWKPPSQQRPTSILAHGGGRPIRTDFVPLAERLKAYARRDATRGRQGQCRRTEALMF